MCFQEEDTIRRLDVVQNPDIAAIFTGVSEWELENAVQKVLNEAWERKYIDAGVNALQRAGFQATSLEHDGLRISQLPKPIDEWREEASRVLNSIGPFRHDPDPSKEEILEMLKEKYPAVDWTGPVDPEWEKAMQMRTEICVRPGPTKKNTF